MINETARKRFNVVLDSTGLSQAKFAKKLSDHLGEKVGQQRIDKFKRGENNIPDHIARAIEEVFGWRAAWLYGFDDVPTVAEEAHIRVESILGEARKRRLLFTLMADLQGWEVEERLSVAAPYAASEEESDLTQSRKYELQRYASISRDGQAVDMDIVDYNKLLDRMLGIFEVEVEHL